MAVNNTNTNTGLKTFNTATDKATKGLIAAQKSLTALMAEVEKQVQLSQSMSEEIQEKQNQLSNLSSETEVAVREQRVELNLRKRENQEKVLAEILKENNLSAISSESLKAMQQELNDLQYNQELAIEKAVNEALEREVLQFQHKLNEAKSDHQVASAKDQASISSLTSQVEFLTKQIDTYKEMLDNERVARVATAEAEATAAKANSLQQKTQDVR